MPSLLQVKSLDSDQNLLSNFLQLVIKSLILLFSFLLLKNTTLKLLVRIYRIQELLQSFVNSIEMIELSMIYGEVLIEDVERSLRIQLTRQCKGL